MDTNYICELCNKIFTKKSSFTSHKNRKTSCKKDIITNKKDLGQFYTTNYSYILQNLKIPKKEKNIIEPFAGQGDLLNFIEKEDDFSIECYDIDPKKEFITKRDTLLNPPEYKDKFVITNPPYLARNKSDNKELFDKYNQNDLYKCLIDELTRNIASGGILIIPLNFWCSIRKSDVEIRKKFIDVYNVLILNIFEEKVFVDTSYTICSFQFEKKDNIENKITECYIYPEKKHINFDLNKENNYTIGGEIYNLKQDKKIKIERLTTNNEDSKYITNILVKCIDDNINSKIDLKIVKDEDIYIDKTPNLSARSYTSLIIEPKLTLEKQHMLVKDFNEFLNNQRDKYHSLFLTNYRESNTIARKRISFTLVFEIVNYLVSINKY